MQKQDFEKQVQYKLDELSLTPSAPVWQKVEQEIRQKKKRRLLAFWLFPLLLVGAAGAYWGMSFSSLPKSRQLSTAPAMNSSFPQKQAENAALHDIKKVPVLSHKTTDGNVSNIQRLPTATSILTQAVQTSVNIGKAFNYEVEKRDGIAENTLVSPTKRSITVFTTKKIAQAYSSNKNKAFPIQPKENTAEASLAQLLANSKSLKMQLKLVSRTSVVTSASIPINPLEIIVTLPLAKSADITPAADSICNGKQKSCKPKWSWVVQASTGLSSLQTALLLTTATTPELSRDPLSSAAFPPPVASNLRPSAIEKGMAFHVSTTIKRNLNYRLSATAGLKYSYFSTKNYVGQSVTKDTLIQVANLDKALINQFYRNVPSRSTTTGPAEAYTNKYHFIELPVGIEWQPLTKIPLRMQTGFSLSYLVASNALVFDPNAGIYYQGKDLLNLTQAHFFGSLQYEVWSHEKFGIHLGPYLQYGISGLQKQKESNNYHLLSVGVTTQVSFK